jgi:hypothetical protein
LRYRRGNPHAVRQLAFVVGPLLVALIWLHGVVFHIPNNYALLPRVGFFRFSFWAPDQWAHWQLVLALMLLPLVYLACCVPLWRRLASASRKHDLDTLAERPERDLALLIGFVFEIVTGIWLHAVPERLLTAARPYAYAADELRVASVVLALAAIPALVAALLLRSEFQRLGRQ